MASSTYKFTLLVIEHRCNVDDSIITRSSILLLFKSKFVDQTQNENQFTALAGGTQLVRLLHLLVLHILRGLRQSLHLESLSSFEELRKLILSHVDLASIHKLENDSQILDINVLQNNYWVLGRVLF